ncbi:MAG: C25 family cysteine peptidase [Desulfobacterales bacterium]
MVTVNSKSRLEAKIRKAIYFTLIFFLVLPLITYAAETDPRPNKTGLKIEIKKSGFYRITGQDLADAGVDPANIDPQTLRLFHLDTEAAIRVAAGGGTLQPSDAVEFYADGIDNQFTGTDVYWLYWNGAAGKRIAPINGSLTGIDERLTEFNELLTFEENHEIWTDTPGAPEADYWFWEKLTGRQTADYEIFTPTPAGKAAGAKLRIFLQGKAKTADSPVHETTVSLNNEVLGTDTWTGNSAYTQVAEIPDGLLSPDSNTLTVESSGNTIDVIYVNRIEITYPRRLQASGSSLTFQMDTDTEEPVEISGFNQENVRIFNVTQPDGPRRVANAQVTANGSRYSAKFTHPSGSKKYMAVTPDAFQKPENISREPKTDLKNASKGADYIIITAAELAPGLSKLAELRRRQGFRVETVSIEAIYDTFSFGRFNPAAIRDFLDYAYHNWQKPAPQFVLLAGDANIDYRDYIGTGKKNIVPVHLSATPELGLTPSDNWYAAVDGDDPIPDLYIGRIPGNTVETIQNIAYKTVRYETGDFSPRQALFVADDEEAVFENLNEDLIDYLPGDFSENRIYTRRYEDVRQATSDILEKIDSGMLITNFMGHGDVTRWGAEPVGEGGESILDPGDLAQLSNLNRPTFVTALNCLNGYFGQSFNYSLAEEFVMAKDAGAVACYAPSGLSLQWEHENFGRNLFSRIFTNQTNIIGAAATEAKIDTFFQGGTEKILTVFNLIGDPATRLAAFRDPGEKVTAHTIKADAGIGGRISPSGEVPVFENADETFTIEAEEGYEVAEVIVDGNSQGAVTEYTFRDVTAAHEIRVEFQSAGASDGGGGGGGCFIGSVSGIRY